MIIVLVKMASNGMEGALCVEWWERNLTVCGVCEALTVCGKGSCWV